MATLSIVTHTDKRLRAVCEPIGDLDDEVRALADDMAETMYTVC